jgi:hypothetical protein
MKRTRLQFRIWHVMVAMTICGVFLTWIVRLRNRAERQAAALRLIQMEGGNYDSEVVSPWSEWLAGGPVDRTLSIRLQRRSAREMRAPYGPDGEMIKLHEWNAESIPQIGRALVELPGITTLKFDGTRLRNHTSTLIPNSTQLEYLSLAETGIRSAELEALERVPNLTRLSLRRTSAADDGLQYVSRLSRLESLDLASSDATDEGMGEISRLTNLRTLRLHNTRVTDKGLAALSALRNLEELDLGMTLVSEKSLEHLSNMQVSRRLVVPYEWPPAATEALKRALPTTCEVGPTPYRLSDRPDAKARLVGQRQVVD